MQRKILLVFFIGLFSFLTFLVLSGTPNVTVDAKKRPTPTPRPTTIPTNTPTPTMFASGSASLN